MVQDIRKDEIGVILFGKDTEILSQGTKVVRTKKRAGVPGRILGRVMKRIAGRSIDGLGPVKRRIPAGGREAGNRDRKSVGYP